jgi:hypothetical protein
MFNMEANVKQPGQFNKNSMFGVGWGVGYGPGDDKTESYLALWAY